MTVLPDVLQRDLNVVFCGSAAGTKSALLGAYYAGPGNAFWPTLHDIGLVPRLLKPSEYREVLKFGIGLTDLNKMESGSDHALSQSGYDVQSLLNRITRFSPKTVAFNGKKAAKAFYGCTDIEYGAQDEGIMDSAVFVLPSTSGAARGYWDKSYWVEVADFVRNL